MSPAEGCWAMGRGGGVDLVGTLCRCDEGTCGIKRRRNVRGDHSEQQKRWDLWGPSPAGSGIH